jgi:hypothetical protein
MTAFMLLSYRLWYDGSRGLIVEFIPVWLSWTVIGLAAAWTLGLGLHTLALRKDWRRARNYALGGAAAGVPLGMANLIALRNGVPFPYVVITAIVHIALGAVFLAAIMWLVWVMRRPDRDATPDIIGEFD